MQRNWTVYLRGNVAWRSAAVCAIVAAIVAGCSTGGKPTAKVSGKVTKEGQPVTGGSLTFTPIAAQGTAEAGKPGSANVGSDGSYTVGTYGRDDGAVVGKHRVSYSAPAPVLDKPLQSGEKMPASPYDGLVPKDKEVEVKAGTNTINIELVPGSNEPPPKPGSAPAAKS